jgi:large subunit ribosomal protein L25
MTEWVLEASRREARGKGAARQLRRQGMIPAVIYGLKDPLPVKVSEREVSRLVHQLHGVTRVVRLRLAQDKGKAQELPVLIKEVQTTAVGNRLLHIDFNEVDTQQTVRVNVEIRPVGHALGVKLGGMLQTVLHEVLVECLPSDLPGAIEVDVSDLDIGKSVHVKELKLPLGVKAITDPDSAVIVVSGQMKEEEEVAAAAAPVEGVPTAPGEAPKEPAEPSA